MCDIFFHVSHMFFFFYISFSFYFFRCFSFSTRPLCHLLYSPSSFVQFALFFHPFSLDFLAISFFFFLHFPPQRQIYGYIYIYRLSNRSSTHMLSNMMFRLCKNSKIGENFAEWIKKKK